jgi:hypothetical protein
MDLLGNRPQRPSQNPVKILVAADRKDILGFGPLPLKNRALAGEFFFGLKRRLEQKKMDYLLDKPRLPAKPESRMAERSQVF